MKNKFIKENLKLAPIALFAYNRPWHIKQTINALKKNIYAKQSELFIFSDGPKNEEDGKKVREVRGYIKTINGFKRVTIIEREENLGLAESIITGVTDIVNKYGKIIVLEDDLITSKYFLQFLNEGLNIYSNENKIASIQGYVFPIKKKLPKIFFLKYTGAIGWGTWKRSWKYFEKEGEILFQKIKEENLKKIFDFNNSYYFTKMLKQQIEGKVDSWAIRWYASIFLKNKLSLYPGRSLIFHNGSDGSGTHVPPTNIFDVKITNKQIEIKKIFPNVDIMVYEEYARFLKSINPHFFIKLIRKTIYEINNILKK